MIIKRIYQITLLIATMISSVVSAQDIKKDLKHSSELYQQSAELGANLSIDVQFANETTLRPYQKAVIRKQANKFYYSIDQQETVITESRLIIINSRTKKIIYRDLKEEEREIMAKKYYQAGLDSVVTNYDSAVYTGISNNVKHYAIYSSGKMIVRTDLFIDVKTGLLNKVIYDYNEKLSKHLHKVAITFAYPGFTAKDQDIFKEEIYLVKSGNQYKPAQKYFNYELSKVDNE